MEEDYQAYEDRRFKTPVDEDLHCPICTNVLKEPMQCQWNEHYFCSSCIRHHLQISQKCPICMDALPLAKLQKAPRFVWTSLSKLEIDCDYSNRGCGKLMRLDALKTHVDDCEFAPVKCSNKECVEIINKRDLICHENLTCKFRKTKCSDCAYMRTVVVSLKEDNDRMRCLIVDMEAEMKALRLLLDEACSTSKPRKDIVIAGGWGNDLRLNSVEIFNWTKKAWERLPAMIEQRAGGCSIVYENQIIVTGGRIGNGVDTNSMERMCIDEVPRKWTNFPGKLPVACGGHKCLVYKDSLFVIGGLNTDAKTVFDTICEVPLTAPYSSKLVGRMPLPNCFHEAEIDDDKIFIFGGSVTSCFKDCIGSVFVYNITTKKCQQLSQLPQPMCSMATVKWKDNVILIGGIDRNGKQLNTVIMYNVKSGEISLLPAMKYKRGGCSAVCVENMIVVMGGYNDERSRLNTVEYFNFDCFEWKELPSMNERRCYASTAVTSRWCR